MVVNDALDRKLQKEKRTEKWVGRFTDWKWWGMIILCVVFPPFLLWVLILNFYRWQKNVNESKTELKVQKIMMENERNDEPYDEEAIARVKDPWYDAKKEIKKEREKNYSWSWWLAGVGIFVGGFLVFPPLAIIGFIVAAYQSMKMTIDALTPSKK